MKHCLVKCSWQGYVEDGSPNELVENYLCCSDYAVLGTSMHAILTSQIILCDKRFRSYLSDIKKYMMFRMCILWVI